MNDAFSLNVAELASLVKLAQIGKESVQADMKKGIINWLGELPSTTKLEELERWTYKQLYISLEGYHRGESNS